MFGFAKHLFHGGTHWVSHHWKAIVVIGEKPTLALSGGVRRAPRPCPRDTIPQTQTPGARGARCYS